MIPKQLQNKRFRFIKVSGTKAPIEIGWTVDNNYKHNDEGFLQWLKENKRYGVACGKGALIVVDFDQEWIQEEIAGKLPETFTIRTAGKGLYHMYFICTDIKLNGLRVKDINNGTLADIQGLGTQVVGPNSILPNGKTYKIVRDIDIAEYTITKLKRMFSPWIKMEKISERIKTHPTSPLKEEIYSKIDVKKLLGEYGISTDKNPTDCPLGHESHGGKCFSYNNVLWHCFHCEKGGTVIELVMHKERLNMIEAEKFLANKVGIDETHIRDTLIIPSDDQLVSRFAESACDVLSKTNEIFLKTSDFSMVEIRNIEESNKLQTNIYQGFSNVSPQRFVNIVEKHADTVIMRTEEPVMKSLSPDAARTTMENDIWLKNLPKVERIFTCPIPILRNGKLGFPKEGYDNRYNSWLQMDSPKIDTTVSISEAKDTINLLYEEFCFEDAEQDKTAAIAHLLSEFCQGLYPTFNTRTPMTVWSANRERAGKDYGAVIPGLVFEGVRLEDPPISTDNKNNNGTEELRKKITTMLRNGRRRFHSSNNRGCIRNEVLENFATNPYWADRLLGSSTEVKYSNEIFISLSVNSGYTATPDFINRCRFVRLHLAIEDANARKFEKPQLHSWILRNRDLILSSLFRFILDWYNAGKPKGATPFASYPEWAEIVGGIMVYNGLGDPCVANVKDTLISPDRETLDMKLFFEVVYEDSPDKELTKKELINIIKESGVPIFNEIRFNLDDGKADKSGRHKFAYMIERFVGRIFSDIKLYKAGVEKRAEYQKYVFSKNESCSYVVNVSNQPCCSPRKRIDSSTPAEIHTSVDLEHGETVTTVTQLRTPKKVGFGMPNDEFE